VASSGVAAPSRPGRVLQGASPGYFPAPSREASRHPVSETPGPAGRTNAADVIARAGGDRGAAWLAFPAPAPGLPSKRVPGERNLGTKGILEALPPGPLLPRMGNTSARARHGCHRRAGPAATAEGPWVPSAPRLPPSCGKLSK